MNESFACGDTGALVAYVYDECESEVRDAIAEHVVECRECLREIEDLGRTRSQLGSWEPPAATLGFQMARPATEPRPWWQAPLPAWAQAAAAALIFAAGLSMGWMRGPATAGGAASSESSVSSVLADAPSRGDLTRLEESLRAEVAEVRQAAQRASQNAALPRLSTDEALLKRVQALIDESEERQRREFTLRSVELARDVEAQRRVDLAGLRETFGQFQGLTGAEIRQQREAIDRINNFIKVSQGR
jgi:hypothetical protein